MCAPKPNNPQSFTANRRKSRPACSDAAPVKVIYTLKRRAVVMRSVTLARMVIPRPSYAMVKIHIKKQTNTMTCEANYTSDSCNAAFIWLAPAPCDLVTTSGLTAVSICGCRGSLKTSAPYGEGNPRDRVSGKMPSLVNR
jgi:hypothetical protein